MSKKRLKNTQIYLGDLKRLGSERRIAHLSFNEGMYTVLIIRDDIGGQRSHEVHLRLKQPFAGSRTVENRNYRRTLRIVALPKKLTKGLKALAKQQAHIRQMISEQCDLILNAAKE